MDQRVTQCPRCNTSFRVTEAHLAVAAGAVRCGSCLHIFNARDHWADEPAKPGNKPAPARPQPAPAGSVATAAVAPAAKAKPAAAAPAVDPDDDDLLFDDNTPLFGDEDDGKPGGSIFSPEEEDFGEEQTGPEKITDTFMEMNSWEQDTDSFGTVRETAEPDKDAAEADEQWARKLLEEEEQVVQSAPPRSNIFDDFSDFGLAPSRTAADSADADGEPGEIFLDVPDSTPLSAGQREVDADAVTEALADPDGVHIESIDLSMTPLHADQRIGEEGKRPLFKDLEPEPLQLHQFRRESRWPPLLWGGGVVLALLLLLGQYLYFNFDQLGRGELRPYLAQVCAVFSCTLPTQSDVARIRTSSLIVRSHPTHKGALAVDAIITNQAPFPQPYPVLQLQFSDLNGAPVAGRQFTPEEYLGGELTGSRLMPVQQPVHIALELHDPGPRAVNYLLTVVAATGAAPAAQ